MTQGQLCSGRRLAWGKRRHALAYHVAIAWVPLRGSTLQPYQELFFDFHMPPHLKKET